MWLKAIKTPCDLLQCNVGQERTNHPWVSHVGQLINTGKQVEYGLVAACNPQPWVSHVDGSTYAQYLLKLRLRPVHRGHLLKPGLNQMQWAFLLHLSWWGPFCLLAFCSRLPQLVFAYIPFPFFNCPLSLRPCLRRGSPDCWGAECLEEGAVRHLWRRQGGDSGGRCPVSHLTVTSFVQCLIPNSSNIWLKVKPVLGSLYHLFQTALCAH